MDTVLRNEGKFSRKNQLKKIDSVGAKMEEQYLITKGGTPSGPAPFKSSSFQNLVLMSRAEMCHDERDRLVRWV